MKVNLILSEKEFSIAIQSLSSDSKNNIATFIDWYLLTWVWWAIAQLNLVARLNYESQIAIECYSTWLECALLGIVQDFKQSGTTVCDFIATATVIGRESHVCLIKRSLYNGIVKLHWTEAGFYIQKFSFKESHSNKVLLLLPLLFYDRLAKLIYVGIIQRLKLAIISSVGAVYFKNRGSIFLDKSLNLNSFKRCVLYVYQWTNRVVCNMLGNSRLEKKWITLVVIQPTTPFKFFSLCLQILHLFIK